MTRTWYKALTALLWLAPVAMGIRYAQVWNELPQRMASHFDAAGRANGWMPRDTALYFDLGLLVFLAAVFTVVLLLVLTKYDLVKLKNAYLRTNCVWKASSLGAVYFSSGVIPPPP